MFNILCHINRIHKILLFLKPAYFYSLSIFFQTQISLQLNVTPHTIFNTPSTPLHPAIFTVHIHFLNLFNTMLHSNERCGAKQSLHPFTKPTTVLRSTRQYPHQYVDWVKFNTKRNACEIFNVIWEILFSNFFVDHWNSKNVYLSRKIPGFL